MKETSLLISTPEIQRYLNVTGHNVAQVTNYSFVFAGSSTLLEHAMARPYSDLIEKLKQHFGISGEQSPESASPIQQSRNHISALNGFLTACGKTVESNIGAELGSQFDAQLRKYLDLIQVSSRTKRDRTTQLRMIRRIYYEMPTSHSGQKTPISLSSALRAAIAQTDLAPKTLAKEVGITPSTLRRWLHGAHLNQRGIPSLRRLEHALGLERDALVKLAGSPEDARQSMSSQRRPAYRCRISEREPHGLTLPDSEMSALLREEWQGLFAYKTGGATHLERTRKGTWRLIPATTAGTVSELARRRNMVCPTADMFLEHLRCFLGVLFRLPISEGGIAWNSPPSQTLAWFAHPDALTLYLDWLTDRSDGLRHSGQRVFAQFAASLLRPITGYLWQQPNIFRQRLPESFRPADDDAWREMCKKSHSYLRTFLQTTIDVSRRPDEPISDLLALEQPLKPLLQAIDRLDAAAATCPPGSISEARHKRDALLLGLLVSNPLRLRTIASLTWSPDGHGSLRGSPTTGWRIALTPHQLKNGGSRRGQNYDVRVATWLQPRLEAYLEEFRNTLLNDKPSEYLLVSGREGKLWEGIGARVRKLTEKLIPGSPGFGPHAIRHIVATDWLRRYPGEFMTVAELLNDQLETVMKNYAHLKRDDSFSRYEAHVKSQL